MVPPQTGHCSGICFTDVYKRQPYVPCLFCSNNQWVRGSIRLLNAATGYNPFSIWIDGRLASSGLGFPEITRYNQISQGYHVFTVAGTNGYTYLRKSLYVGGGMATVEMCIRDRD